MRILLLAVILLFACGEENDRGRKTDLIVSEDKVDVVFNDVSVDAGIDFVHYNGASGKTYFPEMAGSGGGWLDYNGDGWQDLLLVQGTSWPADAAKKPTLKLFRNVGDGQFTDVTEAAGLDISVYGMGMAAADYDNDGDPDLLVTCVGPNRFFRNDNGKFSEVAERVGLADPAFSTSAMFFDYDKDGFLDLYVCNYVEWSSETDVWCSLDGTNKGYCTPEVYKGVPSRMYRNRGDGTFEDVTKSSGVYSEEGKALGVAILDFNDDGWPDMAVANDTQPDFLYQNNGVGADGVVTFGEVGLMSGFALDESGKARAGMGIDVGVVDDTGEETIFVGNFSNEMIGVYRDLGNGSYVDRAAISRIGNPSLLFLTFGVFLFDVDLDFDLDLLGVNGHVQPQIEEVQQAVTFRQSTLLFRNVGDGRFEDISKESGAPLQEKVVGRGAAYADYDQDGDLDILLVNNNAPAKLLRNDSQSQNRFLRVQLQGTISNRDGIGARVTAFIGDRKLPIYVKTGSTYLSQSELPLTFGSGRSPQIDRLVVEWPSGKRQEFNAVSTGAAMVINEDIGIIPGGLGQ